MSSKTIEHKLAYLNKIQKEIADSINVDAKYKLKVRLDYVTNKLLVYEQKSKELLDEKVELEKKLEETIAVQNETLALKKQKFKCPCGSIVQVSKKVIHYGSKKHCLFLDKNPEYTKDVNL